MSLTVEVRGVTLPAYDVITPGVHSDVASGGNNITGDNTGSSMGNGTSCGDTIPASWQLFDVESTSVIIVIGILWLCVILILANFFEEVHFFLKNFRNSGRGRQTIYVLAMTPIFAMCAILGVMVPRAGTLVDLVSNAYLPTAMLSLHTLFKDYLGGRKSMRDIGITHLKLNTPPLCCILPCLPQLEIKRRTYVFLIALVYQATIIRPLLMLIACVLWVDGSYIPGNMSPNGAFIYLVILNMISSMTGIWGLLIIQNNYKQYLQKFRVTLKFLYLQFILLGTSFGSLVFGMLVSYDVIKCTPFLPSSSRAQTLYHSYVIILMFFISIWGRFAYRRKCDAPTFVDTEDSKRFFEASNGSLVVNRPRDQNSDDEEGQDHENEVDESRQPIVA